jgi:serine/threonine protein kinase
MTKKGVLKIGDFGFAKRTPNKKVGNRTVVGTPLYMSLQILKG